MAAGWPFEAAVCRGVKPPKAFAFTSTPAASRAPMATTLPSRAASCREVAPTGRASARVAMKTRRLMSICGVSGWCSKGRGRRCGTGPYINRRRPDSGGTTGRCTAGQYQPEQPLDIMTRDVGVALLCLSRLEIRARAREQALDAVIIAGADVELRCNQVIATRVENSDRDFVFSILVGRRVSGNLAVSSQYRCGRNRPNYPHDRSHTYRERNSAIRVCSTS